MAVTVDLRGVAVDFRAEEAEDAVGRAGGEGAGGGGGEGAGLGVAAAGAPCSRAYTRASSREGKSIGCLQCGHRNRAWTGGILSKRIENVPAQFGQVNEYATSDSANTFLRD